MNLSAKQSSAVRTCLFFLCIFVVVLVFLLTTYRPAKITDVKQQHICIKFCFKFGKTTSETHRVHKEALGENALCQTQTYKWVKRFSYGRMSVDKGERS